MTYKPRRLRKWLVALLILILFFGLYVGVGVWQSRSLESTPFKLALPAKGGITGTVRVAQVSDLHLAEFGPKNQDLVDLVASKKPDIIIATGDMIDRRAEGIEDTVDLFRRFMQVAPVIFSLGNHEIERDDVIELLRALTDEGVSVVQNSAVTVHVNGLDLRVGGVYHAEHLHELDDDGSIDILLCHFPHKLEVFSHYGVPLTFCGHTHGGQFRIPVLDIALYAPGQGLFPQYTAGVYRQDESYMIVSRGLGNSSFPFRMYNPPEVVIADVTYTNQVIVLP